MAKGAIVGRHGGPLPTFVGLFYAAQMRISTTRGEVYRFSCPPSAMRPVGDLHQALNSGEFPSATDPAALGQISFQMDYPDALAKKLLPFGRSKAERALPELEMGVVPLVGGPNAGEWVPDAQSWGALVGCKVLVAVAELASVTSAPKAAELCDGAFAKVITEAPAPKPRVAVVFQLPGEPQAPKAAKEGEDPPPAIPPLSELGARQALGASLASALLPRTAAALAGSKPAPAYFFAWAATERTAKGVLRVRRRQLFDAGGVEPDYPYDELKALVDELGRMAG